MVMPLHTYEKTLGGLARTPGPASPPHLSGVRQAADTAAGRRGGAGWHRRDPAARGALLLAADRLASATRRWRLRGPEGDPARPQGCDEPSPGRRTRPVAARQQAPRTALATRRGGHRNPKKVALLLGLPIASDEPS